jgi:hypothetical protein
MYVVTRKRSIEESILIFTKMRKNRGSGAIKGIMF